MDRHRRLVLWLAAISLMAPLPAAAQEWTRFRGPNGTGISPAKTLPVAWSEKNIRWKIELPGVGHSSPVLWGDRIFLTSAEDDDATRHVMCLRAGDGQILWSQKYDSSKHTKHQLNSFASSSPAVDEERVYVAWSTPDHYELRALSHQGQEVWRQDLGTFASQHSCGTSPILFEELVILGNDQDGDSFLAAFDRRTGQLAWQSPRKTREVSYATPSIYQPTEGPAELIFNSGAHGISSINPLNGQTNWELDLFDKRTVSSPVQAGDLWLGTCGSGGGGSYVVAIKPGRATGSIPASLSYKITKSAPYVPTPLAKDPWLFLWSDQGVVSCVRADTGEVAQTKRVGGRFFGSPVWAADHLYCVSDAGEVVVLAADDSLEILARNPLGEGSHATPAIAGERMYVHTFSHLIAVGQAD